MTARRRLLDEQVEAIRADIRSGMPRKEVAAKHQISLFHTYKLEPARHGKPASRKSDTLTVAPLSSPAPAGPDRAVRVLSMTHEQVSQLAATSGLGPAIVAGQVQAESLKRRILRALDECAVIPTVKALASLIRRPGDNYGRHELTHLVWSLQKQGYVKFRESKRATPGAAIAVLERIEITAKGRAQVVAWNAEAGALDTRVLERLCREGEYRSAASLAADVWAGTQDDATAENVVRALVRLNKAGLVVYREGEHGTPVDVKPTPKGWEKAGFPTAHQFVGPRRSHTHDAPQRKGDRTDFRTHLQRAEGGPVDVEPLVPDHAEHFPEHVHNGVRVGDLVAALTAPPTIDEEPAPEPDWPQLQALRARVAAAAELTARVDKLVAAAAMLEAADAEEAARLMDKAEKLEAETANARQAWAEMSEVEREYLRYAEEHGG